MIPVYERMFSPYSGSWYRTTVMTPRAAWRAVARAARVGAEVWFFTAAGRTVRAAEGRPVWGVQVVGPYPTI